MENNNGIHTFLASFQTTSNVYKEIKEYFFELAKQPDFKFIPDFNNNEFWTKWTLYLPHKGLNIVLTDTNGYNNEK